MLDKLPAEIVSQIALHLALPSGSVPVSLLLTSKSIHRTLAISTNPDLYAHLFRCLYDTAAVQRRRAELTTAELVAEFKRRVVALRKLGRMVRAGDVHAVKDDELWVIYMMLIENDGKNLAHLFSRDGTRGFHLPAFLRLYHEQHLLAAAVEPGYPDETVGRALAIWISWLVAGYHTHDILERPEDRDERLFVLRPYVFAAQRYEMYFGPWTLPALPLSVAASSAGDDLPPRGMRDPNPFVANLVPRSRGVTVEWYGRQMDMCPPILSQAAILRFFTKKTAVEAVSILQDALVSPWQALAHQQVVVNGVSLPSPNPDMQPQPHGSRAGASRRASADDTKSDAGSDADGAPGPLMLNSKQHDRDFSRLQLCYDPAMSKGMKRSAWRGAWEGSWEGNFSFFDFTAFREMLAGHSKALYEGSFGEQSQVWKLRETYVRPSRIGGRRAREKRRRDALEAADEEDAAAPRPAPEAEAPRALPLNGPVVNAGFPVDQQPSAAAGHPAAEERTLRETIQQQIEAIEGYEQVPPDELDEELAAPDGGEAAGIEILLTGTGHSAWGRFIMKGRVRAWDGMATLVKEYAPNPRGKWLYRGYMLAGDVFVGRWRDTQTREAYVGYEGTFTLNRRS